MVAAGLLPALLVTVYYLFSLSLDPLHGAWYLLMLVTGHSVGIAMSLAGCLLLAAACADRDHLAPARGGAGAGLTGPVRLRPRRPRRTRLARRLGSALRR